MPDKEIISTSKLRENIDKLMKNRGNGISIDEIMKILDIDAYLS